MEKTRKLLLGIFTVALCKYSQAEWNTTRDTANKTVSCGPHDNSSNCTDLKDIHQWSGHFSKCPDEYLHYCIHGMCRFVQEQNTPTCKCESLYIGARCEYLDLGWLVGERREIVIISIISGLVILLLIIVFICICAQAVKPVYKEFSCWTGRQSCLILPEPEGLEMDPRDVACDPTFQSLL
ncbi:hypothetical protein QTP70_021868 [Hemibagrus guttatus]|uniref:EGF-like domain-containing protein n=1 Tax=Hemibagrus guttatus TaxID=175788 RepID=A0AAE0QMB5_9TELE|nr:hypothetical protein QTP70_021868 [Hemibagrus guttatus]KAK3555504.1 hypothetical protein QTP86_021306 [Hemibagrus guttatus]